MDSRLVDVALGLALVFALTSLIATAIAAAIQSKFNMRVKYLRMAVASMFGEDNNKTTPLSERLYKQPLVEALYQVKRDPTLWDKALAKIVGRSGPSYLDPGLFVSAFFDVLAEAGGTPLRQGQATPQEFVSALLACANTSATASQQANPAAAAIPPGFLSTCKALQTLCRGCERDWPVFEQRVKAWFEATAERSIGWFTRRTQTLLFIVGVLLAASLNINAIVIAQALWRDPALRESVAQTAVRFEAEHRKVQSAGTTPAPSASPPASARSEKKVPPPGELTDMEITKLMALLADPLSNASAKVRVQVSRFREAMNFERNLSKQEPQDADSLRLQRESVDRRLEALIASISMLKGNDLDELKAQIAQVRISVASERHIAGPHPAKPDDTKPFCPGGLDFLGADGKEAVVQLCALGIPMGWSAEDIEKAPLDLLIMLLGFLITGVACTLGAQFWFDVLSKVVNLRGSGGKPATPGEAAPGTENSSRAPASPGGSSPAGGPEPFASYLNDAERALLGDRVKTQQVQRNLRMANGNITGNLDDKTRAAIKAWHLANNKGEAETLSSEDIIELTKD